MEMEGNDTVLRTMHSPQPTNTDHPKAIRQSRNRTKTSENTTNIHIMKKITLPLDWIGSAGNWRGFVDEGISFYFVSNLMKYTP